jgi:hypothetical protein
MPTVVEELAADLMSDGDECEVGAWTLRLTVAPDEWADVVADMGEGEWYGRVEWAEWAPFYRGERYARPEWADGAAELLRPHFTDPMWWRPADDVVKDRELRDNMRRGLLDLLEFGYSVVTVEAFQHRDIYGRGCVEAVATLGSVEPGEGVVADIVPELVAEVLAQVEGVQS